MILMLLQVLNVGSSEIRPVAKGKEGPISNANELQNWLTTLCSLLKSYI